MQLKQKITKLNRMIKTYAGIEDQLSDEQQTMLRLARDRKRVLQESLQQLTVSSEESASSGSQVKQPRPSDPPPAAHPAPREAEVVEAAGELLRKGLITEEDLHTF